MIGIDDLDLCKDNDGVALITIDPKTHLNKHTDAK